MIIYLYGDDTRRSREKLKTLTKKFLKEVDPSGINLTESDGSKLDPESLGGLLRAAPFLARRRMVVIERLFENKKDGVFDVLEPFIDKEATSYPATAGPSDRGRSGKLSSRSPEGRQATSSSDDSIIILWEDGTPKRALAKKLTKLPLAENFATLEKENAPEWIERQCKTQGVAIDGLAARALAERFPGNTWALSTELHKLTAYAKRELQAIPPQRDPPTAVGVASYHQDLPKGDKLQAHDIDLLAGNFAEEPLYMLTTAVEAGSLPDAAGHLHTFLNSGTPLLVLMSLIGKLLGNLAAEKRGALSSLKLHPYVEKKIRALGRRVPSDALTALLDQFLSLEYKMKTTRHDGEVEVLRFLDHATAALR